MVYIFQHNTFSNIHNLTPEVYSKHLSYKALEHQIMKLLASKMCEIQVLQVSAVSGYIS